MMMMMTIKMDKGNGIAILNHNDFVGEALFILEDLSFVNLHLSTLKCLIFAREGSAN